LYPRERTEASRMELFGVVIVVPIFDGGEVVG
jgi:hypothetical protein